MSFALFLRHYNAVPPERLDGYSAADFADMSEDERARARAMLTERGLRGDTIDLDGLRFVGNAETVAALSAAEAGAAERGFEFDVQRLETLYVLAGDMRPLARLLAWMDGPDAPARSFAAEVLTRHRLPADMTGPILSRLADGRHEDISLPLIQAWFGARGEPIGDDMAAFQRHLPLIRRVSDAPPAERPALLAELG